MTRTFWCWSPVYLLCWLLQQVLISFLSSKTTSSPRWFLRQCSYWAQFELVVDGGLQARGREREHWWLKVFGVESGGDVVGKKGSRFSQTRRGGFRCGDVCRGCRQNLRLKLQQLTHETEVGWDDRPPLLDYVKGGIQSQVLGPHDVGHANGGGTRDARFAVDEDFSSWLLHVIWRKREGGNKPASAFCDHNSCFYVSSTVACVTHVDASSGRNLPHNKI